MKMKLCKDCNTTPRLNGKSYCYECWKKKFGYLQKRYAPDRRKYIENNRDYVHRYKQACGCKKCGEKRYWILDLHHTNPSNKNFDFQAGVSRKRSTLKDEMRKCIVLCKNCHYDFHQLERVNKITLEQYLL